MCPGVHDHDRIRARAAELAEANSLSRAKNFSKKLKKLLTFSVKCDII
jgi:hypothetical protein